MGPSHPANPPLVSTPNFYLRSCSLDRRWGPPCLPASSPRRWDHASIPGAWRHVNGHAGQGGRCVRPGTQCPHHHHETTARIHDLVHPWKANRRPNYEAFEFKIAEPMGLESVPEEETGCNTCGNEFNTAAYRPLKMKCCGNVICRHCYINWAGSKGPSDASCIYCRGRFFDDP